jgi:hypothetical protein
LSNCGGGVSLVGKVKENKRLSAWSGVGNVDPLDRAVFLEEGAKLRFVPGNWIIGDPDRFGVGFALRANLAHSLALFARLVQKFPFRSAKDENKRKTLSNVRTQNPPELVN